MSCRQTKGEKESTVPPSKLSHLHTGRCTYHHYNSCILPTSLEARLPLLFWLSLPDAFCRCFPPPAVCGRSNTDARANTYTGSGCTRITCAQTRGCTPVHAYTPTLRPCKPTHISPPPSPGDEQHLLIRPSVPAPGVAVGLLLAALPQCHLVCSLSPFTEMCSDNLFYLFIFFLHTQSWFVKKLLSCRG